MPSKRRNLGLDVARTGAISGVLLSHFLLEPAAALPPVWTALVYLGSAGVELFFSLSGFLIGGLLLDLAAPSVQPRNVAGFWFRRWMRTLPLYYILLAVLGWWFATSDPPAWLFLQNFHPGTPRLIPASWSLVLEEYFYLFFPASMLLFSAFVRGERVVGLVAALLIIICISGRTANAAGVFSLGWDYVHTHPFMRMDCAAYVVLFACLYRWHRPSVEAFVARRGSLLVAVCLTLAMLWGAIFVSVVISPGEASRAGFAWWGKPWFVVQDAFLELVFAVLVLVLRVTLPAVPRRSIAAGLVRRCSTLSYSMYLVHMPVMSLVDTFLAPRPGLGKAALLLVATVAASTLTYNLIELPFLALRDRWSVRSKLVSAAPTRP